jgi:hypothetical protein
MHSSVSRQQNPSSRGVIASIQRLRKCMSFTDSSTSRNRVSSLAPTAGGTDPVAPWGAHGIHDSCCDASSGVTYVVANRSDVRKAERMIVKQKIIGITRG